MSCVSQNVVSNTPRLHTLNVHYHVSNNNSLTKNTPCFYQLLIGLANFFSPTGKGQFFSNNKILIMCFIVIFLNIFFHKTIDNLFFLKTFIVSIILMYLRQGYSMMTFLSKPPIFQKSICESAVLTTRGDATKVSPNLQ